ncbi:MAG: cation transporter, partial [Sphingobacteriaceae bacterium]
MPHDHSHHHHHDHAPKITHLTRAFIIGIVLNTAFVVIEVVILAFKLSGAAKSSLYTYGYKRSTIIVSLLNAIILLASVVIIVYEAINRFIHPEPIAGGTIAWVAFAGILVNGVTAWLFMQDKEKDLNIKGAYLHMAVDALVSLGVVISGLIIYFTSWFWVDSLVSVIIAVVIIGGTWSLLKDSLRLSLDGVPKELNLDKVTAAMLRVKGVLNVHHVH